MTKSYYSYSIARDSALEIYAKDNDFSKPYDPNCKDYYVPISIEEFDWGDWDE